MDYSFEWDQTKNENNQIKHKVSFEKAQYAFADRKRIIFADAKHSKKEKRFFCIAKIPAGIVTVRFTYRKKRIRIIGAAFWRTGKKKYLAQ